MNDLVITDPVFVRRERRGLLERLALKIINDERDYPFIPLQMLLTVLVMGPAAYFYLTPGFPWWAAAIYLVVLFTMLVGPYILMLHNVSHRPLYKPKYGWMKHYITYVLGPFFGETPNTYYVHHIGMHHPENNLFDDLSTTMPFDRDRFSHFLQYVGRFYAVGVPELGRYMWRRKRFKLFRRMLFGELGYWIVMAALLFVNWQATLVVFVMPLLFARFVMMAGNWAQHAFIDPARPAEPFGNSITCINTGYNRRCFNDGYHIGHHAKANRHWTEMPVEFQTAREDYARGDAIVFEKVDFFMVWAMLMLKRYDWLAKVYVKLGQPERTREDLITFLKSRTRAIARS